jgi:hypothetical protein
VDADAVRGDRDTALQRRARTLNQPAPGKTRAFSAEIRWWFGFEPEPHAPGLQGAVSAVGHARGACDIKPPDQNSDLECMLT